MRHDDHHADVDSFPWNHIHRLHKLSAEARGGFAAERCGGSAFIGHLSGKEGAAHTNPQCRVLQMVLAHRKATKLRSGALLPKTDCPAWWPEDCIKRITSLVKDPIFRLRVLDCPAPAQIPPTEAQLGSQSPTASGNEVDDLLHTEPINAMNVMNRFSISPFSPPCAVSFSLRALRWTRYSHSRDVDWAVSEQ